MSTAPQEVRFHRSLYAAEAVDDAVRAFADLAKLSVRANAEDILVTIESPNASIAHVIADELANFALSETVARSREVKS